jgi:hypothetical protein
MDQDHVIIDELKGYARVLHRRAQAGEADALPGLRGLREFADKSDHDIAEKVQRRHALAVAALQLGFRSWTHALAVLTGAETEDLGTLLYPASCAGHTNIWSAQYDEARAIREARGDYLLGYRRQFLIVDRYYIDSLGLDPDAAAWTRIDRDWIRPKDRSARSELYRQLVHNTLVKHALGG